MEKDRYVLAEFSPIKEIILSEGLKGVADKSVVVENSLQLVVMNASNINSADFINELNEGEKTPSIYEYNERISIMYVYFSIGEGEEYLTTQEFAEKITCQAPYMWKVEKVLDPSGYGVYFKIYPCVNISLEPREKMAITFNNIISFSTKNKMTYGAIKFVNIGGSEDGLDYLPIFKKVSSPSVQVFECDKTTAGIEDTVHLKWRILGATNGCILTPYDLEVDAIGELDVVVTEDTEFMLYAKGKEQTVVASSKVYVDDPIIEIFETDTKSRSYRYGENVRLIYELKNAYHAYINQGVGKVTAGYVDVIPKQSEIEYILSCLGKDKLVQQSLTITVTDFLEVVRLTYYIEGKDGKYNYNLIWEVLNCNTISLTTSDGREWSEGRSSGDVEFSYDNDEPLTLKLYCTGSSGQKIDRVYKP